MRNRVAFALFLSLLLVGTATWMRSENYSENPSYSLTEVKNTSPKDDSFSIESFLGIKENKAESEEVELSKTDIIGRQLILDYVELATSGQATEANIAALAERYVESIPNLNTVTKISPFDVKSVANNLANFQRYNDEASIIETQRGVIISQAYGSGANTTTLGPELYSLAQKISAAYADAANKLLTLPVPLSLVPSHVKLVNSYLSSAASMKSIADTQKDPSVAFASIVLLNENLEEELQIINEINQILASNGI